MDEIIKKEKITELYETRFIKLFDIENEVTNHYYEASRRDLDNLVAIKEDAEFKKMKADAIGCCIIVEEKGFKPRLLLTNEFRFPIGRYILSPTSGLIDKKDLESEFPEITAAKREIFEETGLTVKDTDDIRMVNPLLFASPATVDESCALIVARIKVDDLSELTTKNKEETELFNGFMLYTKEDVIDMLKNGRDKDGKYYSIFTWVVMMEFLMEENKWID